MAERGDLFRLVVGCRNFRRSVRLRRRWLAGSRRLEGLPSTNRFEAGSDRSGGGLGSLTKRLRDADRARCRPLSIAHRVLSKQASISLKVVRSPPSSASETPIERIAVRFRSCIERSQSEHRSLWRLLGVLHRALSRRQPNAREAVPDRASSASEAGIGRAGIGIRLSIECSRDENQSFSKRLRVAERVFSRRAFIVLEVISSHASSGVPIPSDRSSTALRLSLIPAVPPSRLAKCPL